MKGDIVEIKDPEEIKKRLREEMDSSVRLRLIFLNAIANCGLSYDKATEICGLSISTGYVWIRRWNAGMYEGLKDKDTRTGRPPRLSPDDLDRLREYLQEKDYWVTKDVQLLIKEKFEVDLSYDQVIKILRNKLDMNFSKPYPMDYRRPPDAEAILENQLDLVLSFLKENGLKEEEIAIGFIDEARPQNTANTVKVWSFGKVRSIKNTTKFSSNTIGFYSIHGNSTSKFLEDSTGPSIAEFIVDIRKANEAYKAIVVIIDNFSSHKSAIVRQTAKENGIYFVYLPKYSPDLNPIEFIWKSIKRVLSTSFVSHLEEMNRIITESWRIFSASTSYASSWINKFLSKRSYYKDLCK